MKRLIGYLAVWIVLATPLHPAHSQDMGDMGGMDPGMGDMGGMDPGMGDMGGMDPGMGDMGGMDPGMGDMGGMDPGMGDMGGTAPGMGDMGGTAPGMGGPMGMDPGPVVDPGEGNLGAPTPSGGDGAAPAPPEFGNPFWDGGLWGNGLWGNGLWGGNYGFWGNSGLWNRYPSYHYRPQVRTYPMTIVPRHGTLSEANIHHGRMVMVPHFLSHTDGKLYPITHHTLATQPTTAPSDAAKPSTETSSDAAKPDTEANSDAVESGTKTNSDVIEPGTKTNSDVVEPGTETNSDTKAVSSPQRTTVAPPRTASEPIPSTTHVAVPAVPYRVNGRTHLIPVLNPPPIPRMRVDPAPQSPVPVFDSYPSAHSGMGGIGGSVFGPNYHTPVYGGGMGMWLGMPTGGGGFISMPIR